ncbi:unnamed protein product [Paramecium primaurelia]|uniref:CHAT domain-containing protein n=1 Tax=Paramecium primaurelia TaxID=5886 RepID=A0A8S1P5L2_PARPR|nr:unnamed protein product [Paramecium primaurelia]
MRNPKKIKIILFGLKKFDEQNYFLDTEAFIEKENPPDFPLNQIGSSQGIILSRLENYVQIKTKYLFLGIKGKFIFSFYNPNTKTFYDLNKLLKDDLNFIFLNFEFCDVQKPLLVRLYLKIDRIQLIQLYSDLEKNKNKLSKLEQDIQKLYINLEQDSQILKQLNEEIKIIKDQDYSQNQKSEIAILYSHPVEVDYEPVKFNEEIIQFLNLMKKLNKKISYYITQATKHNLLKVLRQNPKIIYIICHGCFIDNTSETYLEYEKDLEDIPNFCEEKVKETDFSQILNQPLLKRALVFLSCCHSGKMAEIFHDYGYPTIAIKKNLKLEEKAANLYFQCFYEKLLQNLTFRECHVEASKQVENVLGKDDYQICRSHEHNKMCLKLFKKSKYLDLKNQLIEFQQMSPCCNLQQDKLQHKLDDDQCEVKKKISEFLEEQFQDKKNNFLERLDQVAKQKHGLLEICCCELARIFFFNPDDFQDYLTKPLLEIEHRSSKTFKLFGDQNQMIFNFIDEGDQIQKNKVQWQEEDVVKIEETQFILKKLLNIFQEKQSSKIIFVAFSDEIKDVDNKIRFLKQVSNYFKQRYIEQSKLLDIKIKVIDNIQQISQYEVQELIKYILIIKEINQEQWDKNKQFLLNLKHTAIVPYIYGHLKPDPQEIYPKDQEIYIV